MKYLRLFLICMCFVSSIWAKVELPEKENKRGKSFSIFSVVQFENNLCTASTSTASSPVQGTCFTSSECGNNGGTATGTCASGFGVCCVITQSACGSTISRNITYIQNPGFPTPFTTVTTNCAYTLGSTADICQLRLDFVTMVLGNPITTAGGTFGSCAPADRMVIASSSGNGNNAAPPVLCGTLTGSHIYVETGRARPTGATLTISNGGIAGALPARSWRIKVTQIECGNVNKAPTDCVQYYTGISGSFTSFNYQAGTGQFLQNQNYQICIRQEEGFCTIQYDQNDQTAVPTFKLANVMVSMRTCMDTQVLIPTTSNFNSEAHCGGLLNELDSQGRAGAVQGSVAPFNIGVFSTNVGASFPMAIGFNLNYQQVPC